MLQNYHVLDIHPLVSLIMQLSEIEHIIIR